MSRPGLGVKSMSSTEKANVTLSRHTSVSAKKAHRAVRTAVQQGLLQRDACEVCGARHREDGVIVDAHHECYSRPLDVTWLCRRHHRQIHADIRAGLWVKP